MFSLRSKISPPPQVQTSTKNSNIQRCSVKRLFSPDDVQVAKRPKTMSVKRPSISPLQKPLLHGEDFLSECLQVIGDTQNSKGTKFQQDTGLAVNGRKPSKAGQIHLGYSVLTSGAKEKIRNVMPSLKPLSVKRASSLSSNESSLPSSLSECEEECAFTVITEHKDVTEYNSCPTDLNTSGGCVISTSFEKPSSVKTSLPNPNKSLLEVESSAFRDRGTDGKGVTSEDHLEGLEDNWFDDKMEESFSNTMEEKSNAGYDEHI